jgi:hypothetical protein
MNLFDKLDCKIYMLLKALNTKYNVGYYKLTIVDAPEMGNVVLEERLMGYTMFAWNLDCNLDHLRQRYYHLDAVKQFCDMQRSYEQYQDRLCNKVDNAYSMGYSLQMPEEID